MDEDLEFPHLDPALIAAIVGDCEDIQVAREALEGLNMEAMVDADQATKTERTTYQKDLEFLQQSFPDIAFRRLMNRYEACGSDLDRVVDELLNAGAIDEMGVEAYTQQYKSRKHARKKRPDTTRNNNEESRDEDVGFLTRALEVDKAEAERIYERNGQNLARCLNIKVEEDAGSSQQSATPAINVWTGEQHAARPKSAPDPHILTKSDTRTAEAELAKHNLSRDQAFQHSRDLYRRGNSNPLMRSAAGVYSELAREHHTQSKGIMDRLHRSQIESQSSESVIDCHGVPAAIAIEYIGHRLSSWLYNPREGQDSLKIITGSGQHSAGGVPKIKNMVRRRLRTENSVTATEHSSYFVISKKPSYRH
ncbi:hypothetical protein TRICI_001461 [Trichomonascus ciferrii]|uniref:Smr domain-containing protein n=1 Tax=Trichomonascus ciferrii TaxID=44093 RepID=A0A642VAS3_9ASCO|nr:hypothetical protein TRICI_001461 [Trichomonascus ciferrii]